MSLQDTLSCHRAVRVRRGCAPPPSISCRLPYDFRIETLGLQKAGAAERVEKVWEGNLRNEPNFAV